VNNSRALTPPKIAISAAFALSCFGLLLFLWLSFGGAAPLGSKSYRFHIQTQEALGLVSQADVRISGVSVGKVSSFERDGALTDVTVEIDPEYAPRPVDTRAVLRQKTLLGETYIELTPGSPDAGMIPEDGTLAASNVEDTVRIDQLLKTFNGRTRDDIQTWLTSLDAGLRGRGDDLNAAFGQAGRTAVTAEGVLGVLDRQREATRRLVHDSGVVFGAIGNQEAAVQGLITNGERLLQATAARDDELAETLQILPTFLRELRPTMIEVDRTSRDLDPVVSALAPVAATLKPTLRDVATFAPDLKATFEQVRPLTEAADRGLPAATNLLVEARPLMGRLYPLARDLLPATQYLKRYRRELIYAWPKAAATTQATFPDPTTGDPLHYLRLLPVAGPEALIGYPRRIASNRHNPYNTDPKWLLGLRDGLESFHCHDAEPAPLLNVPCKVQGPARLQGEEAGFARLQRGRK